MYWFQHRLWQGIAALELVTVDAHGLCTRKFVLHRLNLKFPEKIYGNSCALTIYDEKNSEKT